MTLEVDGETGWGGRIRTSEWRDQNPLPYHLATPQLVEKSASRDGRTIQPPCDESPSDGGNCGRRRLQGVPRSRCSKHARTGAGHPAAPGRQQIQHPRHLRMTVAHHRLAIIASAMRRKRRDFERRGIAGQFRCFEYPACRDDNTGIDDQVPPRRQVPAKPCRPQWPQFRPSGGHSLPGGWPAPRSHDASAVNGFWGVAKW